MADSLAGRIRETPLKEPPQFNRLPRCQKINLCKIPEQESYHSFRYASFGTAKNSHVSALASVTLIVILCFNAILTTSLSVSPYPLHVTGKGNTPLFNLMEKFFKNYF